MEVKASSTREEKLSHELLEVVEQLFGSHPGFRPLHAKGVICAGTFEPTAVAAQLTRAPHVKGGSIKTVVRFSNSTGVPLIPDNDPNASPRGIGIRFYLGEHVHTDIVAHSHNGFPTRTGEEFLEMLRAIAATGPDSPKPTPVEEFMSTHPHALDFAQALRPIPKSYASETFFAVTAFKFTNADGVSVFGRFQIRPLVKGEFFGEAEGKTKGPNFLAEELQQRLSREPVRFKISVEIAELTDDVTDSTVSWPAERRHVEFGTLTLKELVPNDDPEATRIIFDPIPRVDGIEPSEDPLIELRSTIYLISGRKRRAASK